MVASGHWQRIPIPQATIKLLSTLGAYAHRLGDQFRAADVEPILRASGNFTAIRCHGVWEDCGK